MAEKIISNPQIFINDELILYVPNSLKYVKNTAKTTIGSLTAGGASVATVHSTDVTEAQGKVVFSIKPTSRTIELLDIWASNVQANTIEISSQNGDVAIAYSQMSLESVPDLEFGADKEIEVTFLGDPIA
jgi:hypothetical protein